MPTTKTKKTFDCIEFKRKVQVQVYEETREMSAREQIEYFTRRAESGRTGKWWKKVRNASGAKSE